MGGGGPVRSTAEVEAGGVLFSLLFASRRSSSFACLLSPLDDLGRDSRPARFVDDFVFFGFSGDGSRDFGGREDSLMRAKVLNADFECCPIQMRRSKMPGESYYHCLARREEAGDAEGVGMNWRFRPEDDACGVSRSVVGMLILALLPRRHPSAYLIAGSRLDQFIDVNSGEGSLLTHHP
ncbi:hypothetical protein HYQ46_004148 [Verticillium longisporum]|nr:hypothetical protein HYQ46_004148 [Verticillium longisporum]